MALLFDFICLQKDGDMIVPTYANGYNDYVSSSDVTELIEGLKKFAEAFDDEQIARMNEHNRSKMFDWWNSSQPSKDTKKKKMNEGYVYLLECGGKHKIGYSKNVEQRMKQLDTRPFPLTLVCKVYSNIAYDIEQELHRKMEYYREAGEWYDFGCDIPQESFQDGVKRVEQRLLDEQEGM